MVTEVTVTNACCRNRTFFDVIEQFLANLDIVVPRLTKSDQRLLPRSFKFTWALVVDLLRMPLMRSKWHADRYTTVHGWYPL